MHYCFYRQCTGSRGRWDSQYRSECLSLSLGLEKSNFSVSVSVSVSSFWNPWSQSQYQSRISKTSGLSLSIEVSTGLVSILGYWVSYVMWGLISKLLMRAFSRRLQFRHAFFYHPNLAIWTKCSIYSALFIVLTIILTNAILLLFIHLGSQSELHTLKFQIAVQWWCFGFSIFDFKGCLVTNFDYSYYQIY